MSQSELANRVGVEGPTMVAMLDRLERSQLIKRSPSPNDRRIKHVVVTPQGSKLYLQVRLEADVVRRQMLDGIDPQTLAVATELLELLQKVADRIR